MSIDAKRRAASAAFVVLLALSVVWPAPVVSLNALCCRAAIGVDDLSFLGREAPSWDVVFWCLAGLLLIAIVGSVKWRDFSIVKTLWRPAPRRPLVVIGLLLLAGIATFAIWRWLDQPITAIAESVQTSASEDAIRIANRFGGGMNPAMIVIFYLVAGVAYRMRRWVHYAVAMALAGASAGIVVQVVKFAVGRTRPELWLGAFHHARASASSFPSGHTVGAFALAGVLVFAARSHALRATAIVLALAVAVSRVLAFRHWTSDVFASMCIGLIAAWLFVSPVTTAPDGDP